MTFKEISARLEHGNLTPDEIANYRQFCAAWLYRLYETFGMLISQGAGWQTEHRGEYKSQAETERAWYATDEGKEETTIKNRIRGIEAMQEVLTSLYFQTNKEMRLAEHDHGL